MCQMSPECWVRKASPLHVETPLIPAASLGSSERASRALFAHTSNPALSLFYTARPPTTSDWWNKKCLNSCSPLHPGAENYRSWRPWTAAVWSDLFFTALDSASRSWQRKKTRSGGRPWTNRTGQDWRRGSNSLYELYMCCGGDWKACCKKKKMWVRFKQWMEASCVRVFAPLSLRRCLWNRTGLTLIKPPWLTIDSDWADNSLDLQTSLTKWQQWRCVECWVLCPCVFCVVCLQQCVTVMEGGYQESHQATIHFLPLAPSNQLRRLNCEMMLLSGHSCVSQSNLCLTVTRWGNLQREIIKCM